MPMNADELFNSLEVASESPRLQWMRQNGVTLHSPPSDMVGMASNYGDTTEAYYAVPTDGLGGFNTKSAGMGATADEALADYAVKHGLRLWNETPDAP